jgi:hypothetical protein
LVVWPLMMPVRQFRPLVLAGPFDRSIAACCFSVTPLVSASA